MERGGIRRERREERSEKRGDSSEKIEEVSERSEEGGDDLGGAEKTPEMDTSFKCVKKRPKWTRRLRLTHRRKCCFVPLLIGFHC